MMIKVSYELSNILKLKIIRAIQKSINRMTVSLARDGH